MTQEQQGPAPGRKLALIIANPATKGDISEYVAAVRAAAPPDVDVWVRYTRRGKAPLAEAIQAAFGTGEDGKPRLGKGRVSGLGGVARPTGGLPPARVPPARPRCPSGSWWVNRNAWPW